MTKIFESEYGSSPNNFHISKRDDTLSVVLTYPPRDNENPNKQVRYVEIDQESVRASDGVRLFYDYERDGFVVQQASRFAWNMGDKVCDPDWQEVAFIQSWARQETDEEQERRLAAGE